MLKVFICEDDSSQRFKIETIIKNFIMIEELDLMVALSTHDPYDILNYIEKHHDTKGIFFLDVDLGSDIDGIQLGAKIRNQCIDSKIIFITTHSELLSLTFTYKVEAMDYIAKDDDSILASRVKSSINQALQHYQMENTEKNEKISIKVGSQIRTFPLTEVMFFETSPTPHKIELHLLDSSIEFYGKINDIVELSPSFKRVHNSFIVNQENVVSIDKKKREIKMSNGEICLASARLIRNVTHTSKSK